MTEITHTHLTVEEKYQDWYGKTFDIHVSDLQEFIKGLATDFSVPDRQHIVAAAGLAAMRAAVRYLNGGINEHEHQQIIANVFSGWMNSQGPLLVAAIHDMMNPDKEHEFRELPPAVWQWLQNEASVFLQQINAAANSRILIEREEYLKNSERLRKHLQKIIDGYVPFGWKVAGVNMKKSLNRKGKKNADTSS